jgi:Fe-S cluster assembly protein SufD
MSTVLELINSQENTSSNPEWLKALKTSAQNKVQSEGLPTKNNESWKFTKLDILDTISGLNKPALNLPNAPEGFQLSCLSDEKWKNYLCEGLEQSIFSYANTAQFTAGVGVTVSATTNQPLIFTSIPERLVLKVNEGCSATIIINDINNGVENELSNTMSEFIVSKNATLNLIYISHSNKGHRFHASRIDLAEKAQFNSTRLTKDGDINRNDIVLNFNGTGADANLNGIGLLSGETKSYNHMLVNHFVGGCTCKQHFKNILNDKSFAEFSGLVYVHKNAHETDSQQHNHNLLLSDSARVMSRPQLQIDADDVECAHGSTIGQLNPEEIFYIQSRGMSESEAKSLLTFGFAKEIVDTINNQDIKDDLTRLILNEIDCYVKS